MAKRFISRIELTEPSEKLLRSLSEEKGMTQIAVLSRLVEWFANESPTVQAAVLGCYPKEISAEVADLLLKAHDEAGSTKTA